MNDWTIFELQVYPEAAMQWNALSTSILLVLSAASCTKQPELTDSASSTQPVASNMRPSEPTDSSGSARPRIPDNKQCKAATDCFVASSCLGCNRCFSSDPTLPIGLDCAAKCIPDGPLTCVCLESRCVVVRPEPRKITLEEVNKTPCKKDADCVMAPIPCQSGCGHPAINKSSPLYEPFIRQIRIDDPCCKPNSRCPVATCAQTMVNGRCDNGRCVLTRD